MRHSEKVERWNLKETNQMSKPTELFLDELNKGSLKLMQCKLRVEKGRNVLLVDSYLSNETEMKVIRFQVFDPIVTRMKLSDLSSLVGSTIRIISFVQCKHSINMERIVSDTLRLTKPNGTKMTIYSNFVNDNYPGIGIDLSINQTIPKEGYQVIKNSDRFAPGEKYFTKIDKK